MKTSKEESEKIKVSKFNYISGFMKKPREGEYIFHGVNSLSGAVKKIKYYLNDYNLTKENIWVIKTNLGYAVAYHIDKQEQQSKVYINLIAKKLGTFGGKKTVEKYGKEQMKEWGKKGGRPKAVHTKNIQKLSGGMVKKKH